MEVRPLIVGLGGTTRANSSSERILRACLDALERRGARVQAFCGPDLLLPMYEPGESQRTPSAARLISAIRDCDGLVLVSPGYHGSISGLMKNALDYLEDLRGDARPYLHDRPVGCIGCAYGWQGANSTLGALRAVVHALRGWPTPFGGAINTSLAAFDEKSGLPTVEIERQLGAVADQILSFARMSSAPGSGLGRLAPGAPDAGPMGADPGQEAGAHILRSQIIIESASNN